LTVVCRIYDGLFHLLTSVIQLTAVLADISCSISLQFSQCLDSCSTFDVICTRLIIGHKFYAKKLPVCCRYTSGVIHPACGESSLCFPKSHKSLCIGAQSSDIICRCQ